MAPDSTREESEQSELFALPVESAPQDTKKSRRKKVFFEKQEPHSAAKSAIVADYFAAWAKILAKSNSRILYLDFFSGPGKYDDGSESTPLLVLRKIVDSPDLSAKVITIFGDKEPENAARLQEAIAALPGIARLKFPPIVRAGEFTKELQEQLAGLTLVPTLMFLDPFGYKTVNVDVIRAIIQNHGSECIFFFNYNRVMPAITNPGVRHLVDAIFGTHRVTELQSIFESADDDAKENAVVNALRNSMREIGGGYTLPFRFTKDGHTTHHLVFVSTHHLGHDIMKQIMGGKSSDHHQEVPSFEFREGTVATDLFASQPTPIDDLKADLLETFAGKALTVKAIYEQHNLGTRYVPKNYKEALKQLMREGLLPEGKRTEIDKPALKAPYNVMPDDVLIQFPGL